MRITCAVVDDDKNDLLQIGKSLAMLAGGTEIIICDKYYDSPEKLPMNELFDLYILDIDMPETNGFRLATKIYSIYPEAAVVFCTSYEDLVFDSLKLNAFYFVRKSFLSADLTSTLQKFIAAKNSHDQIYLCKTGDDLIKVPVSEIVYFEVLKNELFIHLRRNTELRERKSMKTLLEEFSREDFIKVSRNYLVNSAYITEINDSDVMLSSGQKIAIPYRQQKEIKSRFTKIMMRRV